MRHSTKITQLTDSNFIPWDNGNIWKHLWLPQDGGLRDHGSHHIWIHVGSRPSVLKIPFPCLLCVSAYSDGCPSVCDALSNNPTLNIRFVFQELTELNSQLEFFFFFTHKNVLMSAVSCRPVSLRSLPSPYAAMCSLCLSPSFSIAFLMIS